MNTYTFDGWRTIVLQQRFYIEAATQDGANKQLWEMQNDGELDCDWFDLTGSNAAEIKYTDEQPDFYDGNDDLVQKLEEE